MSPAATLSVDEARASILDAADDLFYRRGIAGVGMAEVRDAAGVSLRRLYSLYPSKSDLVAAWLQERHRRWMAWFTGTVDRIRANGTDSLLATFDALSEWVHSPGFRGCAFINTAAETTELDESHRKMISDHKRALIDHLVSLATQRPSPTPDWLPSALAVLLDGAIVQSAVLEDDTPVAVARRAAERLLEGAR